MNDRRRSVTSDIAFERGWRENKEILNWHLLFIIFTLASRKVFNGCIVRKGERKDAITQNSFTKMFNWDIIFPLLGVTSMVKLYIYH